MANPSQPAVTLTPKPSVPGSQPAITLTHKPKPSGTGSTGSLKDATFELAHGWHVTLYSRNSDGTRQAIQLTAAQMTEKKPQLERIFAQLNGSVDTFNGILKADGGVTLKEGTNVRSVAQTDVSSNPLARDVSAVGVDLLQGIKNHTVAVNPNRAKSPSSSQEKSTQSSKGASKSGKTGKGSKTPQPDSMNPNAPFHKRSNPDGAISSKDLTIDTAFSTDVRQANLIQAVEDFGELAKQQPAMIDAGSLQTYLTLLKLEHPNKDAFEFLFASPGDFAPIALGSLATRGQALVKPTTKNLVLPLHIEDNHFGVIVFQRTHDYGLGQDIITPLVYNPTGGPLLDRPFRDENGTSFTITAATLRALATSIFGDTVTVNPPINYSTHPAKADHQVAPNPATGELTNHCAGYCGLMIENLVSDVDHTGTPGFKFGDYCATAVPVEVVQAHAKLVQRDLRGANTGVREAVGRHQDAVNLYNANKAIYDQTAHLPSIAPGIRVGSEPKFSLNTTEKATISAIPHRFGPAVGGGHRPSPLAQAETAAQQEAARQAARLATQQASVPASGSLLGGAGPKAKTPLKSALKKQPPQPAPQPQASSLSRGNVGSAGVGATIAGLTAVGLGLSAAPIAVAALAGGYLGKRAYDYATRPTQPPASAPQSAPAPQPQAPQPKSAPALKPASAPKSAPTLQPQAPQQNWDFVAADDDEDYPMHPQEAHAAALARREPAALNRAALFDEMLAEHRAYREEGLAALARTIDLAEGDASTTTPPLATPPRKPRGRVQKAVRFDDVPKVNTFTVSHVGKRKVPKLGQKKAGAPKTLVPVTSQVPVTSHVSSIEDVD